jgi:WD40 repeat protein
MPLADPLGLAFRWSSAELYVSNRGGNTTGLATIVRYSYDAKNHAFGSGSTIVSGYSGFHWLTFNNKEDEIFVGTNNEGMRHFKLQGQTWMEQPRLAGPSDWIRGVAVSPDGKRLYASTAGYVIRQWDLNTNQELPAYTVADTSAQFHGITLCGPTKMLNGVIYSQGCSTPQLYVNDAHQSGPRAIYRFTIDAQDNLTMETKIDADPTFTTTFAPDTQELFSGSSSQNLIQRFKISNNMWQPESTTIPTKNSIGTILVFPENVVPLGPN